MQVAHSGRKAEGTAFEEPGTPDEVGEDLRPAIHLLLESKLKASHFCRVLVGWFPGQGPEARPEPASPLAACAQAAWHLPPRECSARVCQRETLP